jgi:hypothetical protein
MIPGLWRDLDSGTKGDWNDYGKAHWLTNSLSEPYRRNGFQWFFHCAQNLMVCAGLPPTAAPTVAAPATVVCTSVDYDNDGLLGRCQVNFDHTLFAGLWIVITFRPMVYSGNMSCPSGYHLMRGHYEPSVDYENTILEHNYVFGSPQLGWRGFWYVYTMDTQGLRSAAWSTSKDYTEP